MKNHILASLLLTVTGSTVLAQQSAVISVGGGLSNSSSDTKNKAYTGNGYQAQADVFIPFLYSGGSNGDAASKFALGVIAGGAYHHGKNLTADAASTEAAYKLYNGQLDVSTEKGGSSNNGFSATAGLQASFALGRLSLSPSFSGGFFSLKQKGFVQRGNVNGKPVALVGSPEEKHTGFMTIPQLRISYPLAANLYVYASSSLLMGPKISTEQLTLIPAGGLNDQHTYEPQQLAAGQMQSNKTETNYRALNINAGISLGFGNSSRRLKGKVTKPGDNGAKQSHTNPLYNGNGTSGTNPMHNALVAAPGSPIGGIVVKGGKNPGGNMLLISDENGEFELTGLETGSYEFKLTAPDEAQAKSISEKGVKRSDASAITTPDQSQGKSISEKGVKRVDASALAKPGNPIGGIIVKGGKNPGGGMTNLMVDDKGTIKFDVLEAGNYKFIIQTPEDPAQQKGKKVVEKATSGLKDTLKTNV
ncbi:MAG: hypothetical protein DI535_23120 [Citrobacter freundii]|nr:MAG: hypothetical protein DI535_23120 [Citrobacter freundii]